MNHTGAGLIDPVTLASVRADILSIVEDTELAPAVATLRTPGPAGQTLDLASGALTRVDVEDQVECQIGEVEDREYREGWEQADLAFQVIASRLATAPTTETRVSIASASYEVVRVSLDPLSIFYRLLLRRRKGA